ncbi:class I adenylate-forming enzyme family protein [Spongiibacter marinus]|uniref:class I adenylate-forming enzyme family protein n=1 Tax=Spongiibacter marinus TaxID=354246 RepID=UPI0035BE67B3
MNSIFAMFGQRDLGLVTNLYDLLKKKDFRQFVAKPFSSIGYKNSAKAVLSAKKLKGQSQDPAIRYFFQAIFRELGDRPALITDKGICTFVELESRVVRLANSLYESGVREGDRVAILLDNEQAWFEFMLACMWMGIKMPMISTHLKPTEITHCVNACEPKVFVYAQRFTDTVVDIESDLTSIEMFVCAEGEPTAAGHKGLESLIARGNYNLPPGGFGVAQMPFSGGSTGVPKFISEDEEESETNPRLKGVDSTEMNRLTRKFVSGFARLGLGAIKEPIVSLIPGPLYHTGSQIAVAPLYIGGTVIPMRKFDPEKFLALIESNQANFTFVVPTMLERILKLPDEIKRKYDLSSMKHVVCSASPCPDYVKKQINSLFKDCGASGNVFNEFYGSSEVTLVSVLRPRDYEEKEKRYQSVGKAVASDTRIYNVEEKRWCETGELGHVLLRNPRLYRVHAGQTDEISDSLVEVDGVYWYDDGCIGYLDEDEFLYLSSRSKDMIISGGVNIFPTEIEEVLKKHKDVLDVTVVCVADKDLGEVPGALVQTVEGKAMDFVGLERFAKAQGLYGFKMPKYFRQIDIIPRNSAGKVRKKELEDLFAEHDKTKAVVG